MHFGHQIRDARELLGMTQGDLARQLEVTQQAVQRWESIPLPPTRSASFTKLCEILKLEAPPQFSRVALARHSSRVVDPAIEFIDRPPRRSQIDATLDELRQYLPETLAAFVGQPVLIRQQPYHFHYYSPRLLLQIVNGGLAGVSPLTVRNAAWRLAIARTAHNDFPISTHHYAVAVLASPEGAHTARIDKKILREMGIMDIKVLQVADPQGLATAVIDLEKKPTDYEQYVEANRDLFDDQDFEDLL